MIVIPYENKRAINITFKQASTDTPLDITGYSVRFSIVSNLYQGTVLLDKYVSQFPDPTKGQCIVVLTKEDTKMNLGNYKYEVNLIDANGDPLTFIQGDLQITPSVWRLQ